MTLKDAPPEVVKDNPDVDADWLVIHQQDIQAVVNALWAGGADAISIQNHRVISTTGIKCVGNSVVLHGVPYLPPYRITAIGDRQKLQQALDDSKYIDNLQDYVVKFQLGYEVKSESVDRDAGVRGYRWTCRARRCRASRSHRPPSTPSTAVAEV